MRVAFLACVLTAASCLAISPSHADSAKPLTRLYQIGPALARCWKPPTLKHSGEVTVRVAFRRNGTLLGSPTITYLKGQDEDDQRAIAAALARTLADCTPLSLSDGLGGAIAGEIFRLRFEVPGGLPARDI